MSRDIHTTKGGSETYHRWLRIFIPLAIAFFITSVMPDVIQAKSAGYTTGTITSGTITTRTVATGTITSGTVTDETVATGTDVKTINGAETIVISEIAPAVAIENISGTDSGSADESVLESVAKTVPSSETLSTDPSPPSLRLSPALPGPRHISFSDLDGGNGWNSGFMHTLATNPGYAFLASAVVPGLGQAANRQWWKTALFVAVEATAIGVYIHRENRGRDGERYYERFGNENWSVVAYAQYLVANHGNEHGKSFQQLLTDKGKSQYVEGAGPFGGINPAFDIDIDWALIDITQLRIAERNSFYATGFAFSHDLPDYGSQQYYELMSKYFQFGPGWKEWFASEPGLFNIDTGTMPEQFWYHARIGFDFNDDLSVARNMLTVLVANHFVAAFDAYFTQKLRTARMQPTASMEYGLRPTIGMQLRF